MPVIVNTTRSSKSVKPGRRMEQRKLDGHGGHRHFAATQSIHTPEPIAPMHSSHRTFLSLCATCVLVSLSGCANPRSQAAITQALGDAADQINGLKNDVANLQIEIDSLHQIVMKQDSTIARIAAVNNIPIVR